VQYLAGHKYVSSTEVYKENLIDELQDDVTKYHPL
jgi:integrase/recombinase XerD